MTDGMPPSEAPLDLDQILGTLRDLESRLRDREARMARDIAQALGAAAVLGDELRTVQARADLAAELERRQAEFEYDLELAEKVHRSLIPRSHHGEDVNVAIRYRPMRGVGGDLCVVLPGAAGQTFVGVADVTGHGVAAALLATRVVAHLRRLAEHAGHPTEVLRGCNDFLHAHFGETGLFLTAMVACIDAPAARLRLAGAGHPHALLWRHATGRVAQLASQHTLLGVLPQLAADAAEVDVPFHRGDRLLLYTDGITEARNRSGTFLGPGALERVLAATADEEIEAVTDAVLHQTAAFRRGAPEDDILVCVAELA